MIDKYNGETIINASKINDVYISIIFPSVEKN